MYVTNFEVSIGKLVSRKTNSIDILIELHIATQIRTESLLNRSLNYAVPFSAIPTWSCITIIAF